MKRSSWLILACAGLLHLGLLAGWRWQLPLVPYFFDATVLSGGRGLDFYSIYQAGYNARHGWDIYEGDPARVEVVVPYFTPYRYLPVVAYTVGAALSLLSPLSAYKLWVVVLELTLLSCAALSAWHTRSDPDLAARLAAMWLVFTPFYLELFMGQFSLIQAALVLGMLLLAAGPPQTPAAPARRLGAGADALWIASLLWKINTVLWVPVYARLGRWRALAIAGTAVTALTVPYFVVFPAHWNDFVANNIGQTVAGHELGNLGFRQLVYEVLAAIGTPAFGQRLFQLAMVGVVLGMAFLLTLRDPGGRLLLLMSLWMTAFFLISPQVWEHHYVMLLPVLVCLYRERPGWPLGLIWLLLALPTPFGFIGLQPTIAGNHDLRGFALTPAWQPLLQHAAKAVPAACVFAYCAVRLAQPSAAEQTGRARPILTASET